MEKKKKQRQSNQTATTQDTSLFPLVKEWNKLEKEKHPLSEDELQSMEEYEQKINAKKQPLTAQWLDHDDDNNNNNTYQCTLAEIIINQFNDGSSIQGEMLIGDTPIITICKMKSDRFKKVFQPNDVSKPEPFVGHKTKPIKYDGNGHKIVLSLPEISGGITIKFIIKS